MNIGAACDRLFPEDLLERYALGRLSELESGPWEEHLLLCRACQRRLEDMDEFLAAAKAALALSPAKSTSTAPAAHAKVRKIPGRAPTHRPLPDYC